MHICAFLRHDFVGRTKPMGISTIGLLVFFFDVFISHSLAMFAARMCLYAYIEFNLNNINNYFEMVVAANFEVKKVHVCEWKKGFAERKKIRLISLQQRISALRLCSLYKC